MIERNTAEKPDLVREWTLAAFKDGKPKNPQKPAGVHKKMKGEIS
ncbi:MAG: hypothetical protein U9R58_02635 [Chloroflexota bacterium]|nr:hypothetical protein [Chloroflexota bacterium]